MCTGEKLKYVYITLAEKNILYIKGPSVMYHVYYYYYYYSSTLYPFFPSELFNNG